MFCHGEVTGGEERRGDVGTCVTGNSWVPWQLQKRKLLETITCMYINTFYVHGHETGDTQVHGCSTVTFYLKGRCCVLVNQMSPAF